MEERNSISNWFDLFKHIGDLLAQFYEENENNSGSLLFNFLLNTKNDFKLNLFLERRKDAVIDPIFLYGALLSEMRDDKRKSLIDEIIIFFGSEIQIINDDSFFNSFPISRYKNYTLTRSKKHVNDIWSLFYKIRRDGFKSFTNKSIIELNTWRLDIQSFTFFLFCIDYKSFFPLDSVVYDYLIYKGFPTDISKSRDNYKKLNDCITKRNFTKELYKNAVNFSLGKSVVEISRRNDLTKCLEKYLGKKLGKVDLSESDTKQQNFKIIAINVRNTNLGDKQKYSKVLKEGMFVFYKNYKFEKNVIKYSSNINEYLFRLSNLRVSISSIVGENGSGKSSLYELILVLINNLISLKASNLNSDAAKNVSYEPVSIDMYIKTDFLYKVSSFIKDDHKPNENPFVDYIRIYQYQFDLSSSSFLNPKRIPLSKFELESFFYSVCVNYSQYGLNSNNTQWVDSLSIKNDGYQMPVAITPMRKAGLIDINSEEYLSKFRLLYTVLDPENQGQNSSNILEVSNGRIIKDVIIKPLYEKTEAIQQELAISTIDFEEVKKELNRVFNIEVKADTLFVDECYKYLIYKIYKICKKYKKYQDYLINENEKAEFNLNWFKSLLSNENFVLDILNPSHIELKIHQTVNYLNHNQLNLKNAKRIPSQSMMDERYVFSLPINILITHIEFVQSYESIGTGKLLPPAIFDIDFIFTDDSEFNLLSSGEKQRIYSQSLLLYHLFNIDSVIQKENIIKYRYVNVIFDEVELYYHPEMQRKLISDTLFSLKKVRFNHISGINLIFATHSPFILSDIPNQNIVKLKDGKQIVTGDSLTFGANIYELLQDKFFMSNGFIGEWAKSRINEVILFLRIRIAEKDLNNNANLLSKSETKKLNDDIKELKKVYDLIDDKIINNEDGKREKYKEFIQIIGEPIIKNKLLEMYEEAFPESNHKYSKDEIQRLAIESGFEISFKEN